MLARMVSRTYLATALVLWGVVAAQMACAPAQPTAAPVAPAAPPSASVVIVPPEAPPDLSPVPAPDGLSATLHLSRPKATADQIASLLGSSPLLALLGTKLDAAELVTLAVGAPLGALLDLDQPLDLAISDLDSEDKTPLMAGAAVLANPEAARETLARYFTLAPTSPGIVRLQPRDDAPDQATPRPCMIALSPPSTTRLVCGLDKASLLHLGPYLTRTMPAVASNADLRFEVFMRGVHLPRSGEKRVLTPGGSVVVDGGAPDPDDEMVNALTDKMSDDLGSFVVEASTDGVALDLRMTMAFASATSPLTRALVCQGAPDPVPPPAYARLPSDSSFAWYSRGAAPTDLAPLKDAVLASLTQWLADDGYSPSQIEAEVDPIRQRVLTGGPWILGGGFHVDAARAALDAYVAARSTTPAARAKARAALQGWVLAEVDEPAQPWVDSIRALVKVDGRKASGKPRRAHKPQRDTTRLVLSPLPAALKLPEGTLHVEVRTTPNPKWLATQPILSKPIPTPARTQHLFVVPDGPRTWMALAEDPALAATEVQAALQPAATPARSVGSGPLDVTAKSGGGFLTLAGLAMALADDTTDENLRKTRDALTSLGTLPSAGGDPVPFAIIASPATAGVASGGTVAFRTLVPIALMVRAASASPPIF
jgi:hypothetical protein